MRVTDGDARGRRLVDAALQQLVERGGRVLHAGHGVLRVDRRVDIAQRVRDLGRARALGGQREHQLAQELPRLRVAPRGFVDDHELGALEAARLLLAPARLQLGVVPPEGRDAKRQVAGGLDVEVELLAALRARQDEREVAVRVEPLERHAVAPQRRLGARAEAQRDGMPAHLGGHAAREAEPGGRPDGAPAQADLHGLVGRPLRLGEGRMPALEPGAGRLPHRRREGRAERENLRQENLRVEVLVPNRCVLEVGKHGGILTAAAAAKPVRTNP